MYVASLNLSACEAPAIVFIQYILVNILVSLEYILWMHSSFKGPLSRLYKLPLYDSS